MNAKMVTCVCALIAGGVYAVDYEWIGGASSGENWTESSNWRPSTGYPGAGDTAYFPVSVTIDDDFQIADGVLCITNSPGSALELKGVISGSGGILKKGGGAIAFWGSNTFSGGFSAGGADGEGSDETYNGKTLKCNAECGIVALRNGSGFGTAKATVNTAMYIDAAGGMEITSPISKGSESGMDLYIADSGDVVFKEAVEFTDNTRFEIQYETSQVRFEKEVTVDGWLSNGGGKGGMIVFESDFTGKSGGLSFSLSRLHFYGVANSFYNLYVQTHVSFHAKNSISKISLLQFDKKEGVLDLCGADQTMTGGTIKFTNDDVSGYEIRSSAPAQLILNKGVGISGTFRGRFTGMAGLSCSPDGKGASRTFAISDFVQPTRGTFAIAALDVLKLTAGAGFSSLGRLELQKDNGAITLDATASDIKVDAMNVVWKYNKVTVAEGRKIECRTLTYGTSVKRDGTYSYTYNSDTGFSPNETGGIVVNSTLPAMSQADSYYLGQNHGDWNDPKSWSTGAVPKEGDRLDVSFGSLELSSPTPVLGNVRLENSTIVCRGWNAKLSTANLTVGPGSVITCEGPFTNEADKARVWISCADLTVEEGGSIDVTKKGWSCGIATNGIVQVNGYGPGAGRQGTGAAHGGPGGKNPNPRDAVAVGHPPCYGSESQPEEPGSGGYQETSNSGGVNTQTHGGGAVRIEASGTVTVNGSVLANGGSVKYAGAPQITDCSDTAGSGGSIWIKCSRFAGSGGTVEAKGGDGSEPCYPKWRWGVRGRARPGGGGRIAIDYGEGQLVSDLVDMTVSACAGLHTGTSGYFTGAKAEGEVLPLALQDSFRNSAELGSVWFSDRKLLDALAGDGLYGYVAHPLDYSTTAGLSFTRGWVRFWGEGANISIGGDLEISGDARLEVGGAWYTNRVADVSMAGIYAGDTPVKFSVGGNMTVTGGGRFDVRPAGTAGADGWGAVVSVAGNLLVGEGGRMVPWCDVHTGTAAKFSVLGDFAVNAGGVVTADGLGYGAALNWVGYEILGKSSQGFGPGAGTNCGAGGHGGIGGNGYRNGNHTGTPGVTYGDEYVPAIPGSGGGGYGYGIAGNGGGVIYVDAGGTLRVDGGVSANGATSPDESQYVAWNGSGAGGSVCLRGRSMSGSGTVSADGGAGRQTQYTDNSIRILGVSGSGGGGRVSIWTGLAYTPDVTVVRSRNPVADWDFAFTGFISASGGGNCFAYDTTDDVRAIEMPATARGEDGSVRFCYARKVGLVVTFR